MWQIGPIKRAIIQGCVEFEFALLVYLRQIITKFGEYVG